MRDIQDIMHPIAIRGVMKTMPCVFSQPESDENMRKVNVLYKKIKTEI